MEFGEGDATGAKERGMSKAAGATKSRDISRGLALFISIRTNAASAGNLHASQFTRTRRRKKLASDARM